jgi:asparagine synthase (glutamine-hydrolysing)
VCGICGVVQVRGETRAAVDLATLRSMTSTMRHRGPDDAGYHVGDRVAIGVRRLSIIDVVDGHQPFTNERGNVVAAQNGELYNHEAIRRRLERDGHIFTSRCDTEILPHLYEAEGDDMPQTLLGMFAFALWDAERQRALIVRDRLGKKPLYYAEVGDVLVFGSELKAVLASGLVPSDLDLEALDLLLALGFVPGPRTLLRHVRKLLPGHRLVVEHDRVRVEQYWQYPRADAELSRSDSEWSEELVDLLRDAVRIRLMSDVPLGAMLSGGLDSSLIVALMAAESTRPVQTFSVGFSGVPDNELPVARETARALGADHHELELSLDDPVDIEGLVWSLDEPIADLSAIGFAALSQLTARHVTVALSGQGADELLAGYDRYRQVAAIERWSRAPASVRRAVAAAAAVGPARIRRGTAAAAADDHVVAGTIARSEWLETVRSRSARGGLGDVRPDLLELTLAERLEGAPGDGLARTLILDAQLSLVDDMLHYFDRTSMASSLEVRVPFLDHRLVELCARMPVSLKLSHGTTKAILRSAARGLVPEAVLDRPKVGFFSTAVGHWFDRQVGGEIVDRLLDPGARFAAYVDQREVEQLLRRRESYRSSKLLLTLLMLEVWLASYLPRAGVIQPTAECAA